MADNLQYQQFNASKKYVSDAEFTSLDTSTIPVGTEYNIVGVIEESDLSAELQTKVNRTVAGPTGPQGPQGPTGPTGPTGPQGPQGAGYNAGDNIKITGGTISVDITKDLDLDTHHLVFNGTGNNDKLAYIGYENGGYTIYGPQKKNATGNCYFPTAGGTLATGGDITNATQNFITPASLIPGDNISITKASDSEKVTISATGLVKQVTDTVDYDRLYGRTNGGDETTFKIIAYGTDTRSIAQRNDTGQLQTNNPIDNLDAVNKQYFEANGVMQRITYSSDNKTISPTELALLKPGFYTIDTSYTITNGTDSLPKDYYTMIKQGGIDGVPYNDSTYLFQSYNGTVYAYSQYGASGYENKSAFYKLATTSEVATATAVLIDNSLLGG